MDTSHQRIHWNKHWEQAAERFQKYALNLDKKRFCELVVLAQIRDDAWELVEYFDAIQAYKVRELINPDQPIK